jgi:hypothetical protein
MKHRKFFDIYPHADVRHFAKFTREQLEEDPPWKALRRLDLSGDRLAFRAYILRHEGQQTLVNIIMGDHGRPNKF